MSKYTYFWSGPFSQWFRASFAIGGVTYNCAEQYMMVEKAIMFHDFTAARAIMEASDPRQQKAIGRSVKGFDEKTWNSACREIVRRANKAKFTQNEPLLEALRATKGTVLVEASPYDKIWGIGLSEKDPRAQDPKQWLGANWLGFILTDLRTELVGF